MSKIFCPNCGSKDVSADIESVFMKKVNPGIHKCESCGYEGFMPEGDPKNFEFDTEEPETYTEDTNSFNPKHAVGLILIIIGLLLLVMVLIQGTLQLNYPLV